MSPVNDEEPKFFLNIKALRTQGFFVSSLYRLFTADLLQMALDKLARFTVVYWGGLQGGKMAKKKIPFQVVDRASRVQAGDASIARELLQELYEAAAMREKLSAEMYEYLTWCSKRALDKKSDPFGIKTKGGASAVSPWSKAEREMLCYRALEAARIQKNKLKEGRYDGKELKKNITKKFKNNVDPAQAALAPLVMNALSVRDHDER